jgi:DNA gyrase subunit A
MTRWCAWRRLLDGLPLVDGQGNFGSIDGDPPAAMRYTEAGWPSRRLGAAEDIDKDTVDFQPTMTAGNGAGRFCRRKIPEPAGQWRGGIAVGMATNIPPHNLGEIIDATLAMIDNPASPISRCCDIVPGPDFPTGGRDHGRGGARKALLTGRGSSSMRAKHRYRDDRKNNREAIIVTEIPYQVNKAEMIEKIAELVREKRIEGISDLRDESDRDGMRIVIELKRDAVADVVLNQLYRFTADAELVRRQHAGAEWRPARADEPAQCCSVCRLPRGSGRRGAPSSWQQGA